MESTNKIVDDAIDQLFDFTPSDPYLNSAPSNLFKVKKNQLKMIRKRGYDISAEEHMLSMTISQFIEEQSSLAKESGNTLKSTLNALYINNEGELIYVYYADTIQNSKQFGVSQILEILVKIDEYKNQGYNINNIIIITELPLSSGATSELEKMPAYNIEVFLNSELAYDPTEHYLVPNHRIMSKDEARQFLRKNKLKFNQLPLISKRDPIARYYGARVGQIMEISRINLSSETIVDEYLTYRAVRDVPFSTIKIKTKQIKPNIVAKK
jgi:DNA-directed RNA polymerase I, II, and III subunit RPABC1